MLSISLQLVTLQQLPGLVPGSSSVVVGGGD